MNTIIMGAQDSKHLSIVIHYIFYPLHPEAILQECFKYGNVNNTVPFQTLVWFEEVAPGTDQRGLSGRCWSAPV